MANKKDELTGKLPTGTNETQTSAGGTTQTQQQQNSGSGDTMVHTSTPEPAKYNGLPGVSSNTAAQVGQYQQGYTASDAVNQAQAYLYNLLNNKPSDYASNYTQQMNDLYGQIMNRDPFKYNLNEDMLYQQYKDQYQQMGQQAMMDTMGQAAALSGGYGSSYASTAGNQAYQQYLTQLNNMVPELYDRAYGRYTQEGADLMNKYNLAQQAEQSDYSRWQDEYSRWEGDRTFAQNQYNMLYNQDYGQYSDNRNYWTQMAAQENAQYNAQQTQAYNTATTMLANGKMPSDKLLAQAGISKKDAQKWIKKDAVAKSSSGSKTGTNTTTTLDPYKLALQTAIQNLYKP